MSVKNLKAEIKRLTVRIGADEPPISLITLTVVDGAADSMDLPDSTGHVLEYRLLGQSASFFFPFSEMNSEQAEELAQAIIQHTREIERLGRRCQVGILDMTFPYPNSIRATLPPPGVGLREHAAALYRQAIEARHEHAQAH
ncbi:hypothetical protein D3C77_236860 [compost metagenome]